MPHTQEARRYLPGQARSHRFYGQASVNRRRASRRQYACTDVQLPRVYSREQAALRSGPVYKRQRQLRRERHEREDRDYLRRQQHHQRDGRIRVLVEAHSSLPQTPNAERNARRREKKKCPYCAKHFTGLSLHIQSVHADQLTLECSCCERRFMTIQNIVVHRLHKRRRLLPHECKQCHTRFESESALQAACYPQGREQPHVSFNATAWTCLHAGCYATHDRETHFLRHTEEHYNKDKMLARLADAEVAEVAEVAEAAPVAEVEIV